MPASSLGFVVNKEGSKKKKGLILGPLSYCSLIHIPNQNLSVQVSYSISVPIEERKTGGLRASSMAYRFLQPNYTIKGKKGKRSNFWGFLVPCLLIRRRIGFYSTSGEPIPHK